VDILTYTLPLKDLLRNFSSVDGILMRHLAH